MKRRTRAEVIAAARTHRPDPGPPSEPHTVTRPVIEYVYRGLVERWAKGRRWGRATWREGYSQTINGCISYPWYTKRECFADAKQRGARATFVIPPPPVLDR